MIESYRRINPQNWC